MNQDLNLKVTEGVITGVRVLPNGHIYELKVDGIHSNIGIVRYTEVSNFLLRELGTAESAVKGKTLTLVNDDERLLALQSQSGEIAFIKDRISSRCEIEKFGDNEVYILNRYGLTEEELLKLAKEAIKRQTSRLSLL